MKTILGRFDQALAFATVAELGSFTRAAERLGLSKAHVSEQVSALEAALGVQLLHRTTRRLALTETGRIYLDYCRQLRDTLQDAERAVSAASSEVGGRVRMTAPTSFGDIFLPDMIIAFRRVYPAVEVDLDLSIVKHDLVAEGYDLALRNTRVPEEHLVARPLGVIREVAVASPAFLAAHGPLDTPERIAAVPCVINSNFRDDQRWPFVRGGRTRAVRVDGPLRVNFYSAIRRAALVGAGVARLPLYMVRDDLAAGALLRVCAGWELEALPLYLLQPQRRHQPLRTRVFRDFLLRWFEAPERRELFT
ncbi:LysR family transcriptional regulator [Mizugakiibacter sediminis]|uniref:LysR family transcriptional regulator n=1 Tax=Mizugakiibacter sediminis TaxID=1475481 RepID=A0A0K8QPD7_9GAMM|nr:LysR family transcriptional regulator [Mizugakiibacter sediminis]GAP66748.1 LysR family transcriptional regulator [Mizugakiibacter sediminis]